MNEFWKTCISKVAPNEILVRGYPLEDLTRTRSFGDIVYLLLTGELPSDQQGKLMEAILIACCEHSLVSPSVDAVRFVASSGVPLQTAVSAGVSSIGDVHGGAIEPCARLFKQAIESQMTPIQVACKFRDENRRLPGFGHPLHTADPRTAVLLDLAERWKVFGAHTRFALQLEAAATEILGRRLPLNVDGAIAALVCDMDINVALGKAFFIIGRVPGFIAHAFEQMTVERPFKAPHYTEVSYYGPSRRSAPPVPED